ncbi:MAG: DUF4236 domain-containing protein [Actinomycetes bacterium]
MGVYLRKSKSFGPLRLNFSKSGIGVSAGVKGLRVGTRAGKGAYLYGGRNGLYYRKTLSSGSKAQRATPVPKKRAPRVPSAAPAPVSTTVAPTTDPSIAGLATTSQPVMAGEHQAEGSNHSVPAHEATLRPTARRASEQLRLPAAVTDGLNRASQRLRIEHTGSVSRNLSRHVPVLIGVKLALVAVLLLSNVFGLSADGASASQYVGPIALWVGIAAFIIWHRWDTARHIPVTLIYELSPETTIAFEELSSAVAALEVADSTYGVLAEDDRGAAQPARTSMAASQITRLPIHVSRGATIDHLVTDVAYPSIVLADRLVAFLPDRVLFSMKLALRRRWGFMSIPYAHLAVTARVLQVTGENHPLSGSEASLQAGGVTAIAYGDLSLASARHGFHEILRLHTATPAMAERIAAATVALGDAAPATPR